MSRRVPIRWIVVTVALIAVVASIAAIRPALGRMVRSSSLDDCFDEEIRELELRDAERPALAGGVLFIGSSSIRVWDLDASFDGLETVNRGFGGSQFCDAIRHVDRLIAPHRPRAVVVYSGDNDIADGKSPGRVHRDAIRFVDLLRDRLPEATVVVLSIKPSPSRWEVWPKAAEANDRIARSCDERPGVIFVDLAPAILGPDGMPRDDLFQSDRLHLNERGYELWAAGLRPALEAILAGTPAAPPPGDR